MDRRTFVRTSGAAAAGLALHSMIGDVMAAPKRPNILWLTTEDIGPLHGCYGDPVAVTPAIDRLANEGVRYSQAFTCSGVCAPSRYSVVTGRYPTSDGTQHMRSGIGAGQSVTYYSQLPEGVRLFPSLLRDAGYYCTNNFKEDYQVSTPEGTWDESSLTAHWRNRADGQPLFHIVNFMTTHESQVQNVGPRFSSQGLASRIKPFFETHEIDIVGGTELPKDRRVDAKDVPIPPYYPDTPGVRAGIARNHDNVSAMDTQIAAVLRQLEADGLVEDTIVFYWSDHGGPLARGKRWIYDSGIHVPLIVKIPEKYRVGGQGTPGSVDSQLVSFVDLAPTVLNLCGLSVPEGIQGRAFLGSGLNEKRSYVYAARDRMDERYDTVRAVRDSRFKYIRNYHPHKPAYSFLDYAERGVIQKEIRAAASDGEVPASLAALLSKKAAEELYDLDADPHEINNLVSDPDYRDTLERMRSAHSDWVIETRDTGLIPEAEMIGEQGTVAANQILSGSEGMARLKDVRRVAEAALHGDTEILTASLSDEDAVIRYWGAIGLGLTSDDVPNPLRDAMSDASGSVAVAAAQSVAQLGDKTAAIPVLQSLAKVENEWVRLMAVIAIDEMDEVASVSKDALRPLREDPSKYVARVANRTLNRLENTTVRVR